MNQEYANLYQQDLVDHGKNPRNYGLFELCDFKSQHYNPSCGDKVILCGSIQNRIVTKVHFEGSGCILSIAMASKLTEFAKNKRIDDLLTLDSTIVESLLGLQLGINRMSCGTLSVRALMDGLDQFEQKTKGA